MRYGILYIHMALWGTQHREEAELNNSSEHAKKFDAPHEEIAYLRARIEAEEQAMAQGGHTVERPHLVKEKILEYREEAPEKILKETYQIKAHEIEERVLNLDKEHSEMIDGLVRIMMERGIKNTLTILEKLHNPHLEDDFHRFLVQFLADPSFTGMVKERVLFRALHMRLYEITLPPINPKGEARSFADLVAGMEQFYAGMLSVEKTSSAWGEVKNYFTLELALPNVSSEAVFYAAVPLEHSDLFEKQILSAYPDAKIREHKEDYNPFNEKGVTLVSVAEPAGNQVFAMRTFEKFSQDPLNMLLGAFSKIEHTGEGVAIQFVIEPQGKAFNDVYKEAREEIKKGAPVKRALEGTTMRFAKEFASVAKELVFGSRKKEEHIDQEAVENITEKISSPIVDTNIRIVVSAGNEARATALLNEIEATFNQFNKPHANGIKWKRLTAGAELAKTISQYSFRMF